MEREYKIKLQSIKEEIAQKESELTKYSLTGVGGQLGGGILRFIGWVVLIVSVMIFFMGIAFREDGPTAFPIILVYSDYTDHSYSAASKWAKRTK